MILYKKSPPLRIQRAHVPAPPFWAATTIAPYAPRRATPLAIDYVALGASGAEKLEASVCADVGDDLERATLRRPIDEPALIDAAEGAEVVYRRGEAALRFCASHNCAALQLVSTRGALPESVPRDAVIAIAAWPLEIPRIGRLAKEARDRGMTWGVIVPVLFPISTDLARLSELAAAIDGAAFFASVAIDADANARKAIAQLSAADGETYEMLFHSDLEPLQTATERHIAALAAEIGADDFVLPPLWNLRSNWNGAVLLTLTATRMLAMKFDVETASRIARSARLIAQLEKPIARIAAAANLSIVEALDEISVDMLTEWIETGKSAFADHVNKQWRLRRDSGLAAGT